MPQLLKKAAILFARGRPQLERFQAEARRRNNVRIGPSTNGIGYQILLCPIRSEAQARCPLSHSADPLFKKRIYFIFTGEPVFQIAVMQVTPGFLPLIIGCDFCHLVHACADESLDTLYN